jgi:hypothetical protein
MADAILTQDELKSQLHYDPLTGIFTRLIHKSSNAKIGDLVGSKNNHGYLVVRINNIAYKLHRLAFIYMNGYAPDYCVDHINNDRTDNRWCNLREATISQNNRNISVAPRNTSGYKGVSFDINKGLWRASARLNNKPHYIGYFETALAASRAYEEFCITNYQEFYKKI